jgi:hypothetical protein
MKKTILVTGLLSAFILIAMSFTSPAPPEVRYKNLKVLPKNTTKAELDSIMKAFAASLGMKCGGCHVRGNDAQRNWDFASDSNEHKNIARGMMRMTAKLNKKYFKAVNKEKNISIVTCYTCHNGKEHPGIKPPVQQGPPGGGAPGGQQGPPAGGQRPAGAPQQTSPAQTTPAQTTPAQTPTPNQK